MARYYALSIQLTLFGEISLIRAWGRIGTRGQELSHHFASEAVAVALLREIAHRKNAKGYVPKACPGSSQYNIECPTSGTTIDKLRLAAARSQAEQISPN